jgi:hypothetical protein
MKKILYIVFAVVLIAASSGCKKQFDINQNPNNPTTTNVTPQLILPRVQVAVATRVATSYDFVARWMGYFL